MKSLASGAVAGGDGAPAVGRCVSKGVSRDVSKGVASDSASDIASDLAKKTVAGGAAACLSALA
ncbi:hypothetical protein [Streptomyces lydicus]|uniref:hypothetical protein n=1 Tax=Streptomyces lydicus TaxID=47763 RepID=UPI001012E9BD|nr:hypothetical protein [Streptomyces lydicus]MCZ1008643.1 hypothetical protein [Streptomyces lydicus]